MPTAREHRFAISEAVAALNEALKAAHNDNLNVELDGTGTRYSTLEYIDSRTTTTRDPGYVTLYDVSEVVKEGAPPEQGIINALDSQCDLDQADIKDLRDSFSLENIPQLLLVATVTGDTPEPMRIVFANHGESCQKIEEDEHGETVFGLSHMGNKFYMHAMSILCTGNDRGSTGIKIILDEDIYPSSHPIFDFFNGASIKIECLSFPTMELLSTESAKTIVKNGRDVFVVDDWLASDMPL